MARVRLNRMRLNPVPGTKSTQSRYFLGYFVFVDEPDVGYAVSIRAAGPQGVLREERGAPKTVIRDRALEQAQAAAQKLSNKTNRQVAFTPVLPRATKRQAVDHLYGGANSRLYGGPNARKSVTLSRTRLPNRPVVQTDLVSVSAHWDSLYGEESLKGVQSRRMREFSTQRAYAVDPDARNFATLQFAPGEEPTVPRRRRRKAERQEALVSPAVSAAMVDEERPLSWAEVQAQAEVDTRPDVVEGVSIQELAGELNLLPVTDLVYAWLAVAIRQVPDDEKDLDSIRYPLDLILHRVEDGKRKGSSFRGILDMFTDSEQADLRAMDLWLDRSRWVQGAISILEEQAQAVAAEQAQ